VAADERAVARHVGGEDGGESAVHVLGISGGGRRILVQAVRRRNEDFAAAPPLHGPADCGHVAAIKKKGERGCPDSRSTGSTTSTSACATARRRPRGMVVSWGWSRRRSIADGRPIRAARCSWRRRRARTA